jgi:hypothetical protein
MPLALRRRTRRTMLLLVPEPWPACASRCRLAGNPCRANMGFPSLTGCTRVFLVVVFCDCHGAHCLLCRLHTQPTHYCALIASNPRVTNRGDLPLLYGTWLAWVSFAEHQVCQGRTIAWH